MQMPLHLPLVPIVDHLLPPRENASAAERVAWSVCRAATIVSAVALGALAGMTLPVLLGTIGIGCVSYLFLRLAIEAMDKTNHRNVVTKTIAALAATFFIGSSVVVALLAMVQLSTMIAQVASIIFTLGIGYFGGWIAITGARYIYHEIVPTKKTIDLFNLGAGAAMISAAVVIGKIALILVAANSLMTVAALACATSVLSDEVRQALREGREPKASFIRTV